MRKPLLKIYNPKDIFWIIRFNFVVIKWPAVIELTFGILGYGFLLQWCYRKDPEVEFRKRRAVEDAAEDTP